MCPVADCFQLALESFNIRGQLGCLSFAASSGVSSPLAADRSFSCGSFQLQLPWGRFSDGVPRRRRLRMDGKRGPFLRCGLASASPPLVLWTAALAPLGSAWVAEPPRKTAGLYRAGAKVSGTQPPPKLANCNCFHHFCTLFSDFFYHKSCRMCSQTAVVTQFHNESSFHCPPSRIVSERVAASTKLRQDRILSEAPVGNGIVSLIAALAPLISSLIMR